MPGKSWRAFGAVTAFAMALGAGAAQAAETNGALHYDTSADGITALDQVVSDVRGACATGSHVAVTVHVTAPSTDFSAKVPCATADSRTIRTRLVAAATPVNQAGKKAAEVVALQDSIASTSGLTYDHDALVWDTASAVPNECERVGNRKHLARGLASGLQHGETVESWTLVEAVRDAGLCPEQLPDLYRVVSDLGHPRAVRVVEHLLDLEPVTIPLRSIPEGISARAIGERRVFLERDRNHVSTLLTSPHGTPGLDALWWCPTERVFMDPIRAGAFDQSGAIIGGPASRGLDRFATTVNDGTVTVDLRHVVKGSSVRHDVTPAPGLTTAAWDTGPDSFCSMPVKGGQN